MATASLELNFSNRGPTDVQLARWDDDGGNQFVYAELVFVNGKVISGRAAHLHHIITKYWEQLSQPAQTQLPIRNQEFGLNHSF